MRSKRRDVTRGERRGTVPGRGSVATTHRSASDASKTKPDRGILIFTARARRGKGKFRRFLSAGAALRPWLHVWFLCFLGPRKWDTVETRNYGLCRARRLPSITGTILLGPVTNHVRSPVVPKRYVDNHAIRIGAVRCLPLLANDRKSVGRSSVALEINFIAFYFLAAFRVFSHGETARSKWANKPSVQLFRVSVVQLHVLLTCEATWK